MSKKSRLAILSLALAGLVGVSAATSACTVKTKHPRVKISISFLEETYDVEYTLYRNMYPQTVQHFIELADGGFYDNTIIHDYKNNDWLGGAYSYNAVVTSGDNEIQTDYSAAYTSGSLAEYLENNCKEAAYYDMFEAGKFTPSVFKRTVYNDKGDPEVDSADALATLIGEFSENDHKIESGALSASYGALKMMYYEKGDSNQKVTIKNSFGELLEHDYRYNCATSVFTMQMGNSTSYSATKYCVFGELRNDSAKKALQSLTDAIADYVDTISKFTTTVDTKVDTLDRFAEDDGRDIEKQFTLTSVPLIVKTVEVTKY
ncbi:MAG TPA: hypothetical protein DD415_04505 [Clostridiales bacterium]|nr:hypothetical protein [Clostridiales bacterium]